MDRTEQGSTPMFFLRDLPRYAELRARAARYPDLEPAAVEATLVLFRVATDAMAAFASYLATLKMSPGRLGVLSILNREPSKPLSPSTLAERAGVTRATMTGLLDRLERDKLIKRSLDKVDRRKSTVLLTRKGQAFLDGAMPGYYKRIGSMMSDLSETERRALTDMMYRISERVPTITGDGKPAPTVTARSDTDALSTPLPAPTAVAASQAAS
jgi:DNA-binding MarR family transcriptional regulator